MFLFSFQFALSKSGIRKGKRRRKGASPGLGFRTPIVSTVKSTTKNPLILTTPVGIGASFK